MLQQDLVPIAAMVSPLYVNAAEPDSRRDKMSSGSQGNPRIQNRHLILEKHQLWH